LLAYLSWLLGNRKIINPKYFSYYRNITYLFIGITLITSISQSSINTFSGNSIDLLRSFSSLTRGNFQPFPSGCLSAVYDSVVSNMNFNHQSQLIVVKAANGQSDLITRWANSLNGRLDNEVIGAGMKLDAGLDYRETVNKIRVEYKDQSVLNISDLKNCSTG
jgi:hypothetical protein